MGIFILCATLTNEIDPSAMTLTLNGFAVNTNPWILDPTYGNCNDWTSAASGTWVYNGNPSATAALGPGGLSPTELGYE